MSHLCEFMLHLCHIFEIAGPTFNLSTLFSILSNLANYENFCLLREQESVRTDASRIAVIQVMPHRLCQIDNSAVFADACVRVAAGVPALFTAECGDGLGPFAAFAFALKRK